MRVAVVVVDGWMDGRVDGRMGGCLPLDTYLPQYNVNCVHNGGGVHGTFSLFLSSFSFHGMER